MVTYDVVPKNLAYTYGKANCGLSTDVKNAVFFIFFYLVAYLSSYHEKAINALYELA